MSRTGGGAFDPYYKWLGIPGGKRPNHYQLLGLQIGEADDTVIEAAAARQATFVARFRGGQYDDLAGRLLFEIEDARFTLLDPDTRKRYDASLKRRTARPGGDVAMPGMSGGRTVGEESGLAAEFGKVMAVILAGFLVMLFATFYFWDRTKQPVPVSAAAEETPVAAARAVLPAGAVAEPPTDELPPEELPVAEPQVPAVLPINLLDSLDLGSHRLNGSWEREGSVVGRSVGNGPAVLEIPHRPTGEYVVALDVQPERDALVIVGLIGGGRSFAVCLGSDKTWLQTLDGDHIQENETTRRESLLKPDLPNRLRFAVLKDGLVIRNEDGSPLYSWMGGFGRFSDKPLATTDLRDQAALFLAVWGASSFTGMTAGPLLEADRVTVPAPMAEAGQKPAPKVLRGHKEYVVHLALAPAGRLVSGGNDKTVRLWDIDTGRQIWKHDLGNQVSGLAVAPDGGSVWACGRTMLKRLDLATGQVLDDRSIDDFSAKNHTTVAFSPDCSRMVRADDGQIELYSLPGGRLVQTKKQFVPAVAFDRTGEFVFCCEFERKEQERAAVQVVRLRDGQVMTRLRGPWDRATKLRLSPGGDLLAAASGPQQHKRPPKPAITVWRLSPSGGEVLHEIKTSSGWAWAVAFSPDGRLLAAGGGGTEEAGDWYAHGAGRDRSLRLYDVRSGREVHRFDGHGAAPLDAVFTADGKRLISSGADGTIRVWDVPSAL